MPRPAKKIKTEVEIKGFLLQNQRRKSSAVLKSKKPNLTLYTMAFLESVRYMPPGLTGILGGLRNGDQGSKWKEWGCG
jgi:hypothetical protein